METIKNTTDWKGEKRQKNKTASEKKPEKWRKICGILVTAPVGKTVYYHEVIHCNMREGESDFLSMSKYDKNITLLLETLVSEIRGNTEVTMGDVQDAQEIRKWIKGETDLERIQGTIVSIRTCSPSYNDPKTYYHKLSVKTDKFPSVDHIVISGDFDRQLSVGEKIDVYATACLHALGDEIRYSISRFADDKKKLRSKIVKTMKRYV